jgi:hypothetical protein
MAGVAVLLDADQHAEQRRTAQIASLAEHAMLPILNDMEEKLIVRLVGYARQADPVPVEKIWTVVGALSLSRELKTNLLRHKRLTRSGE